MGLSTYRSYRHYIKGGACHRSAHAGWGLMSDSEKAYRGGDDLAVRFVRRGSCDIRLNFGGAWCFSDNFASRDGCEGSVPNTTAEYRTVRLVRRAP